MLYLIRKAFKFYFKLSKELNINYETQSEGRPPSKDKGVVENIWYKNDFQLSPIDLGKKTMGWKALSVEEVIKKLSNNCYYFRIYNDTVEAIGRTTALSGHWFVFNTHLIPEGDSIHIDLTRTNESNGVNENFTVLVTRSDMVVLPNCDITMVKVRGLPPHASIMELLPNNEIFPQVNGYYVRRSSEGFIECHSVKNINYIQEHYVDVLGKKYNVWRGNVTTNTHVGDCGSLLVLQTHYGPVIGGIHFIGAAQANIVCATAFNKYDIESVIKADADPRANPVELSAPSVKVDLIDLHSKSEFRWLPQGNARVYGSLTMPRSSGKSSVEKTPMNEFLSEFGYKTNYTMPDMRSWKPWHLAATDMVNIRDNLNQDVLNICVEAYVKEVCSLLPSGVLEEMMHPYDYHTAVNGSAGTTFVDKMNRNTSMGYPYNKSKRYYLVQIPPLYEDQPDVVDFVDEIKVKVRSILTSYSKLDLIHPVFKANLKDEPVTFEKSKLGKTRVFSGAPVAWCIVVRMKTLSFIRLVQSFQHTFEIACGISCQSKQWEHLYYHLTRFGTDRMVGGDYSKFDKSMSARILRSSFEIIFKFAMLSGNYDEEDMNALRCICSDLIFAFVNFNGSLVQFFGVNQSGHPLTVILNSLVNILYMRMVFHLCTDKPVSDFKKYVSLMTYGDDNLMGISRELNNFNHTIIQGKLSEFNIKYTMADKVTESVPFLDISQCSFLKRSFRYDEDLKSIVAPLDEDSIEKMLMVWTRSKTISAEAQCCAIISSAMMEYFWYGREVFERKKWILTRMVVFLDLGIYTTNDTLPSYESLEERFKRSSSVFYQPQGALRRIATLIRSEQLLLNTNFKYFNSIESVGLFRSRRGRSPNKVYLASSSVELGKKYLCSGIELTPLCINQLANFLNIIDDYVLVNKETHEYFYEVQADVGESTPAIESEDSSSTGETHQSGQVTNQNNKTFETTVRYIDEEPGLTVEFDSLQDKTFYKDYVPDTDLINFLKRPVRIQQLTWVEGTPYNLNINPWDLYFNTASVRNKLQNFAWLSCELKIKVLINSSPFYYGSSLVSYFPNQTLTPVGFSGAANVQYGICTRSQRPHIWLYPQCNQGGEMTLPFLYHANWLPIGNRSAFQAMGSLLFESVTDLGSANGVTGTGVTIAVYAWAENVKLAGPTIQAALQGEFGLISTPASVVANVAKEIGKMGFFKPYARATEIAATAVGNIAKIFGFSNTPVIIDVTPLKSLPFHSLASGEISQPTERLTIDPKQELCLDSRVAGYTGADELLISKFCGRQTFICAGLWRNEDAVDTLLMRANVSPYTGRVNGTDNRAFHASPMAHCAAMFRYWKGDIIYTFRFICSQYHRGRAIIQWDPYGDIINNVPSSNIVYSQIVDLSESTEVEFVVPYMARTPYLQTGQSSIASRATFCEENFLGYDTGLQNYDIDGHNGRLTMRVLTALTSPVATANINILGFIRGADNLKFAAPQDLNRAASFYTLQSELIQYKESVTGYAYEASPKDDSKDELVNFGESIPSLRQILRRSTLSRVGVFTGTPTVMMSSLSSTFSPIPLYRGWDPNGINTATNSVPATAPYNFVFVTPINWLLPCFIGYRGSMNWHINSNIPYSIDTMLASRVVGVQNSGDYSREFSTVALPSNNQKVAFFTTYLENYLSGVSLLNQKTQTGVSINMPMYSPFRMRGTSPLRNTLGSNVDFSDRERIKFNMIVKPTSVLADNSSVMSVEYYCSIGHDFDMIFFINVPVMYYQTNPPPA